MIKILIQKLFNSLDYQIIRKPSLESEIKQGKYLWLNKMKIRTVIDVGANDGGFALKINKILPHAFIYSFEPIKDVFDSLSINTQKISRIKLFNVALGETESKKEFYVNEFAPSSSFLEMEKQHIESFPFTLNNKKEIISVLTLDSFEHNLNLNGKVLLKLDVQGYELNVLKGAESILRQIDLIIIEVSFIELYKAQPLFNKVYNYLSSRGFRYSGNLEQLCDPVTNQILQADAIFIRDIRE